MALRADGAAEAPKSLGGRMDCQGLTIFRENERGEREAQFSGLEGKALSVFDYVPEDSRCMRFIDPFGDTLFNQLQLPVLVDEFTAAIQEVTDDRTRKRLAEVLEFLRDSKGVHRYIRFLGD